MRRLAGLVVTTIAVVGTLSPGGTWAKSRLEDKHDCRPTPSKGGYVCDNGPLAGKTFPSRKAMIEAFRQASATGAVKPASDKPSARKSASEKVAPH